MTTGLKRRRMLMTLAGSAGFWLLPRAFGDLESRLEQALTERFGERRPEGSGVELEINRLVENGNSVAVTVRAAAGEPPPVALHLFMPRNPEPWGTTFRVEPPALPEFSTRIRLAGTQDVVAVAEWPDGRLGATAVAVMVTLGACADDLYLEF